jgi:hypothetical protein
MNKVYKQMELAVENELKKHSGIINLDDIGEIAGIVFGQLVEDGTLNLPGDEDASQVIEELVMDMSDEIKM